MKTHRIRTGLAGIFLLCAHFIPNPCAADESGLAYFHAEFDGDFNATAEGRKIEPSMNQDARWAEVEDRQVLVLEGDAAVRYPLPEGFPAERGSLELVFRADFPQETEEAARRILALLGLGEEGEDVYERALRFHYVPVGSQWRFRWPNRLFSQTGRNQVKEGEWMYLVLTWDADKEPRPLVRLYVNGGGGRPYTYQFSPAALSELELGGDEATAVSVKRVAIYNRPLTKAQAAFLAESPAYGDDLLAALAARVAADDREAERLRAEREAQLTQLEGKVGRLIHLRGNQPQDFEFPEGITATGIRPEEVGEIDLSQFSVIYFPEGTGYQLDDGQREVILDYVRNGGGYVGSCAGANFANGLRLLDFRRHTFLGQALLPIRLEDHAVTDGLGESVTLHHGNGPIMFPGENCRAIGAYPLPSGPDDRPPGAILVGMQGNGRVVLFGGHPLGGPVGMGDKRVRITGEDLGTNRLFVNALLYAAGIVGEDEPLTSDKED